MENRNGITTVQDCSHCVYHHSSTVPLKKDGTPIIRFDTYKGVRYCWICTKTGNSTLGNHTCKYFKSRYSTKGEKKVLICDEWIKEERTNERERMDKIAKRAKDRKR